MVTPEDDKDLIDYDESPMTRAEFSYDVNSTINPNLHSNWESVSTIYLNNGTSIAAPWVYETAISHDIPMAYAQDIKKSDGWFLLSHTLIGKHTGDPNYIIFYNRNRGLLKVFYYNTGIAKNSSLVWALESNISTSILPGNEVTQGPFNSTNKIATTSNIANESISNFGQLNTKWNMFTIELPYGEVSNNPMISIRGYHNENSKISLGGEFSGELTVNLPKESNSKISSITSAINKIPGAKNIPYFNQVSNAVSFLGKFGSSSIFKSKDNIETIKGTTAGTIKLTGTLESQFGGTVDPLINFDLKRINDNIPLGLWTLKETPNFEYNENCIVVFKDQGIYKNNYFTKINLFPYGNSFTVLKDYLVINPHVKNSISSYKIKKVGIFKKGINSQYDYIPIGNNLCDLSEYEYENSVITKSGSVPTIYDDGKTAYILTHRISETGLIASITVEFIYNDGSILESTKNFEIRTTATQVNAEYIQSIISTKEKVVYIN